AEPVAAGDLSGPAVVLLAVHRELGEERLVPHRPPVGEAEGQGDRQDRQEDAARPGRGAHGPATLAQICTGDATIRLLQSIRLIRPIGLIHKGRTMPNIEFTGNYQDLSTDRGYQFKFYCEKCGNGYMSTFKSSKLGLA